MYTEFFGLKEKPFELTPSPRFLYMSESHKEALALLAYGVREQKGFVLLTGEVGTGKTTMVHALLSGLGPNIISVLLSNPLLSSSDLLRYVAFSAFGRKVQFKSKAEFLVAFEDLLLKNRQYQRNFLLIIDEAQRLSFELLEEIRLFSNLETDERKLLNIFLIGQPELNDILNDPQCRPLLQRISIRHHLSPLNLKETREYVATRLRVAGSRNPEDFFHESVIRALHQYSSGYPRLINILADNALLLAYARGKKKITAAMIKECHQDRQLESPASIPNAPSGQEKTPQTRFPARKRRWRWALVALVLLVFAGLALSPKGRSEIRRLVDDLKMKSRAYLQGTFIMPEGARKGEIAKPAPSSATIGGPQAGEKVVPPPALVTEAPPKNFENQRIAPPVVAPPEPTASVAVTAPETPVEKAPVPSAASLPGPMPREEDPVSKVVTVKRGDTVTQLALEIYGYADEKLIDLIHSHNSHIRDINWISVGQKIEFPPVSRAYQGPTYAVHLATYENFQSAQMLFQRLIGEGLEAYIVPVYNPEKGKVFRVAAGSFTKSEEADRFAAELLSKGISDFARTIRMEVR